VNASEADVTSVEELVRKRLAAAVGGGRGIVEAAVPTLAFTITWLTARDLKLALVVSVSLTVVALLVRLVQRSNPQFVINALIGIGIAALFATKTGEARGFFLPGILYNSGYAGVLILSVLVRWPLVGFMVGAVVEEPLAWRKDAGMVKLCSRLTWLLALPCVLRVAVQLPLYLVGEGAVGWLGIAKIAMGWPLQLAALAAMAWLLSRNRTALESD
jgi:hypothetical protein